MKSRKLFGILIIIAGISLIIGSVLINVRQTQIRESLVEEYKAGTLDMKSSDDSLPGDMLYMLRIPSIDSENPVREGIDGAVLKDSLGHDTNSSYAGTNGKCVIAGHRNYTFGKFFNRLDEVQKGDMIYLDTCDGTYSYQVTDIEVVSPDEDEVLQNINDDEMLTLYTCTPIYIGSHRLVINAKRIS